MNSLHSPNPVLLVHGIWDTGAIFHAMHAYLEAHGRSVFELNMTPNNGDGRLEHLAQQISDYIDRTFDADQPLDVVGFSMGGIVSRYYLQRLGGIKRVERFITLSSPHRGTLVAYGSFRPGCMQMRPNSSFLQDLNRDIAMLEQINFTSIWTPLDTMIVPANSSLMPVGKDVRVWVPAHALMVSDPRSLQSVSTALSEPLRQRSAIAKG
ncbi:triacylglycerol lipase [Kovacikia minuta CCNUW1]|uniref:lipase family alpha/beta hydrolase n=1 Tax=Kovacikia minuta TaxID=2931930 RepID=UPI001CCF927B|nr:triacylglycerol lipase [Kovacikia minuta]UBF25854.1 triacylglycerol lipase [Kovacikia minuta CCNUW1]